MYLCDKMSLLLLPSVRSMQEWVGLRAGGSRKRGWGEAGKRYGLVLLLLQCVVGSCSGALGGASRCQQAYAGSNGCGGGSELYHKSGVKYHNG